MTDQTEGQRRADRQGILERVRRRPQRQGLHPPTDPEALIQLPIPGTGTIVIQRGKTLNQMYRHTVDCDGAARLVTTARTLLTNEEKQARDSGAKEDEKARLAAPNQFEDRWPDVGTDSEPEDNDGKLPKAGMQQNERGATEGEAGPAEKKSRRREESAE